MKHCNFRSSSIGIFSFTRSDFFLLTTITSFPRPKIFGILADKGVQKTCVKIAQLYHSQLFCNLNNVLIASIYSYKPYQSQFKFLPGFKQLKPGAIKCKNPMNIPDFYFDANQEFILVLQNVHNSFTLLILCSMQCTISGMDLMCTVAFCSAKLKLRYIHSAKYSPPLPPHYGERMIWINCCSLH